MPFKPNMPGKGFLERIKEEALSRAENRIKREFETPTEEAVAVPQKEVLPKGLVDRIKQTVKQKVVEPVKGEAADLLSNLSVIQRRMLDPRSSLDEPTIKYRIKYAGQNHLLLYMLYNGQWRYVEAYSYRTKGKNTKPRKDGQKPKPKLLFYGWCRIHNKIHAFDLSKIKGLIVTNITYNERYPIEVA